MKHEKLTIELTFTEEILGTAAGDPKVHSEFIASKAPDAKTLEEEVAALGPEQVEKSAMTIFPNENGRRFIYDYQVKGFFKDACASLNRVSGSKSKELKAYKKVIDTTIFVSPRKIFFPEDVVVGECQRPLRAQTAQGERIALAHSETIPAGTKITFEITLLDPKQRDVLEEWLDYGQLRGLGQWRNSGKGKFLWKETSNG